MNVQGLIKKENILEFNTEFYTPGLKVLVDPILLLYRENFREKYMYHHAFIEGTVISCTSNEITIDLTGFETIIMTVSEYVKRTVIGCYTDRDRQNLIKKINYNLDKYRQTHGHISYPIEAITRTVITKANTGKHFSKTLDGTDFIYVDHDGVAYTLDGFSNLYIKVIPVTYKYDRDDYYFVGGTYGDDEELVCDRSEEVYVKDFYKKFAKVLRMNLATMQLVEVDFGKYICDADEVNISKLEDLTYPVRICINGAYRSFYYLKDELLEYCNKCNTEDDYNTPENLVDCIAEVTVTSIDADYNTIINSVE